MKVAALRRLAVWLRCTSRICVASLPPAVGGARVRYGFLELFHLVIEERCAESTGHGKSIRCSDAVLHITAMLEYFKKIKDRILTFLSVIVDDGGRVRCESSNAAAICPPQLIATICHPHDYVRLGKQSQ